MGFQDYVQNTASKVEKELETYYHYWVDEVTKVHPHLVPLVEVCIEANKGGKRLRGVLVDLGYKLTNQSENEDIFKAGAAFEIFQTAILAHDDIIDQSETRRGRPTMYRALGGDHYGISQTICLADVGFFQSFDIVACISFPEDRKVAAIKSYSKLMTGVAIGEILDVELSMKDKHYNQEESLLVSYLKTSTYTFIGPLHLGAILGGADSKMLQLLNDFGRDLGIAFQIHDDILGVFGDEQELGKSVTSDIEEGKNTLLISKALEQSDPEQRAELERYYGKGKVSQEGYKVVKEIFENTGALDYARQTAVQYVNQAKKLIPEITQDAQLAQLLTEMADYLVARQK